MEAETNSRGPLGAKLMSVTAAVWSHSSSFNAPEKTHHRPRLNYILTDEPSGNRFRPTRILLNYNMYAVVTHELLTWL